MTVTGITYGTKNNIITFIMTTFFRSIWFNLTAELRPCVMYLGLIYRIIFSLDTSFEGNYAFAWLETCLPTIRPYNYQSKRFGLTNVML